jgi:hypothetical protein
VWLPVVSSENYQSEQDIVFQPQDSDTIAVEDAEPTVGEQVANTSEDVAGVVTSASEAGLFGAGTRGATTARDIATCAQATSVGAGIGGVIGGAIGGILGALGGPAAPATIPAGIAAGSWIGGSIGGTGTAVGCAGVATGTRASQRKKAKKERQEAEGSARSFWEGLGMAEFYDDLQAELALAAGTPVVGSSSASGGSNQPGKGGNPTQFAIETRGINLQRLERRRAKKAQSEALQTAALAALAVGGLGLAVYKNTK